MWRGISGYLVASLLLHLIIGIILLVGVDQQTSAPSQKGPDRQYGHDGQRNAGATDAAGQQQKQAQPRLHSNKDNLQAR